MGGSASGSGGHGGGWAEGGGARGRWAVVHGGGRGGGARRGGVAEGTAARGSRSARGSWPVLAVEYTQSPEEEDAEETNDDAEAAAELERTLAVGTAACVK